MSTRSVLIVVVFVELAGLSSAWSTDNLPSLQSVRLRKVDDTWGQKVKVGYILPPGGDVLGAHEACLSCSFDADGKRVGNAGEIKEGGTCGGYPNGCVSFKNTDAFTPGATISLALRIANRGDSAWTRPVYYFLDPALKEGMHALEPVSAGEKEEL